MIYPEPEGIKHTCILEWMQISYRSGGFLPLGVFSLMSLKWAFLVTRGPFRFQVAVFYFEHLWSHFGFDWALGSPPCWAWCAPPPCFAVHVVLSVLVHPKFHFSFSKAFLLLNLWMEKKTWSRKVCFKNVVPKLCGKQLMQDIWLNSNHFNRFAG